MYEGIEEREVNRRCPHVVLKVDEDELRGSALEV
jgi:hypothetical protein